MTPVFRRGLGFAVDIGTAAAWAMLAFVLASNFISATAGALIAVAVFLSTGAIMLGGSLQDSRMALLQAGVCPSCHRPAAPEHRHRRWEGSRSEWLEPVMIWECACGFSHSEVWACPACPAAD